MEIERFDHIVLTVKDLYRSSKFYSRVLRMREVTFSGSRRALHFGNQKINLHLQGEEIPPIAKNPIPGSQDICLITKTPIEEVVRHVRSCDVQIIEGPVQKTGAMGPILSVYFLDPDGNLIEVANYAE